jgi:hypothetical protein
MDELMNVFGPWLPLLFGVGTVLLVCGMVTKEVAPDSSTRGLGRNIANVGWRLMLIAAAIYLSIQGLQAVFNSFIANLPAS